jgi:methionyl-tRNA formyltransferase
MRILFVGSKDRGVRCLHALLEADAEIAATVTVPDDDPDAFWDGSVEVAAADAGLPVHTPADINDPAFVEQVREMGVDLIVMSGYNQVLGAEILDVPDEGTINLHAGKLPEYRGGSPMNWAIINGETEGTATVHYATERIDAGPILAERTFPIRETDTIADVRDRTLDIFPDLLVDVVADIRRGRADPTPQPEEGVYWCSRLPQDGRIDWQHMTAREVYDFVRALTHPYPGAFTTHRGERLYVWEASLLDDEIRHAPGRVAMRRGDGRVVAAADRGVLIETVQPEGGDERPAADCLERGTYLS